MNLGSSCVRNLQLNSKGRLLPRLTDLTIRLAVLHETPFDSMPDAPSSVSGVNTMKPQYFDPGFS